MTTEMDRLTKLEAEVADMKGTIAQLKTLREALQKEGQILQEKLKQINEALALEHPEYKKQKFTVTLTVDEEAGGFVVECPALPGCISQGETREEALANIKEAIQLSLEVRAEMGMPLSVETKEVEVFA